MEKAEGVEPHARRQGVRKGSIAEKVRCHAIRLKTQVKCEKEKRQTVSEGPQPKARKSERWRGSS